MGIHSMALRVNIIKENAMNTDDQSKMVLLVEDDEAFRGVGAQQFDMYHA